MKKGVFGLLAVLCSCGVAQANEAITAANNELGIQVGGQNVAYHESNAAPSPLPTGPDGYMDSEIGTMPSVELSYTRQGALLGLSNIYTQLSATVTTGKLEYTSGSVIKQQCSGIPGTSWYCSSVFPVQTSLGENHSSYEIDLGGRIGRAFELGDRAQLTPYVALGGHYWMRHAPGAGNDIYWNGYAGAGLLAQYAVTPRLVVGLDAGVSETFNAYSEETDTRYPLGSRPMLTASLGADYAMTRHWHVTAAYTVSHWRYGASPFESSGTYEPADWTTTQAVMVGLAYSFR
jgi:opacity protein-like surface antigen